MQSLINSFIENLVLHRNILPASYLYTSSSAFVRPSISSLLFFMASSSSFCFCVVSPRVPFKIKSKPLIAAIPGADGLGALQIVLREAQTDKAGNIITNAVILDFGEVISAIITFFLTAIILFIIVKVIVKIREKQEKARLAIKKAVEDKLRADGKLPPLEDEKKPEAEEEVKPTTEELLTQIRDLLASKKS